MLSTADLEAMRSTMVESLPDVCQILGHDLVSDNAGGHTATADDPVEVACRVSPLRLTRSSAQAEVIEVERVVEQSLWLVTMPEGTAISPVDQISHGERTFEVVEVLSPRSWNLATRASCKLVNSGAG